MNWFNKQKAKDFSKGGLIAGSLAALAIALGISSAQLNKILEENNYDQQAVEQKLSFEAEKRNIEVPNNSPKLQPPKADPQSVQTPVQTEMQKEPQVQKPQVERPEANSWVARVIYSEASSIVSKQERELVASVILNRINHPGFGNKKLSNMEDVVNQSGAFEAIGDEINSNWSATEDPSQLRGKAKEAWVHSLELSRGDFKPLAGRSGRPLVYYHDKSISKPRSWDNKYWTAIKEVETEHFIFYSVVPTK